MRSWDLSDWEKGIWEWDCGYGEALGARIWGRKCFQHEGGGARGCKGNCRGPELGSSVDSSGEQESREAKHVVLNWYVG